MQRRQFIAITAAAGFSGQMAGADAAGLGNWINGFRGRARAAGIADTTLDRALGTARYLPASIDRDRNQAEFVRSLGDYMASAASDARISTGQAKLRALAGLFDRIAASYGVEPHVVAAIWGMESNFGARRGDVPVISTLATLAYDGRRGAFFEDQLIAALAILQRGDTTADRMVGSWAGAMGHTQFIPTSYQAYAVDFTGDGRRDIWSEDPSDALASTAAYLRAFNWTTGQPWGAEVILPAGFDYSQTGRRVTRSPSAWARLGVVAATGGTMPDFGDATISTPTGAGGPAFMLFRNYDVIARYNNAEAYILGVGHLSDRIKGLGPLRKAWPVEQNPLRAADRRELQQRLTAAGFNTGGVDGRIGPNSRAAIMAFQRSRGLVPDGNPTRDLLDMLR
jgi:membrane-bound lytic murein transglycosylase B